MAETIHLYTDGSCIGNPGPMGLGVVLVAGDRRKEISEYLGEGTNNVAELTAILQGLRAVKAPGWRVIVYSDSTYSIGVLSKGWKAKANQELIACIKSEMRRFSDLSFVKVPAHSGVPENERCDELAKAAITNHKG